MTLCMVWRLNEEVHFASDSRLSLAANSYADVGIKVFSLPLPTMKASDEARCQRQSTTYPSQLGVCFAGSAVNSLTIKDSVVEIFKSFRHSPTYATGGMDDLAGFVFAAYKVVSQAICETALGPNGRSQLLVGGLCQKSGRIRVFLLSTDVHNHHSMTEVLTERPHEFIGTGKDVAESELPQHPDSRDYLNVLKCVIDRKDVPSVGGPVQYGCFRDSEFVLYGLAELGEVRFWRGGIDLCGPAFQFANSAFVPGWPDFDPLSMTLAP